MKKRKHKNPNLEKNVNHYTYKEMVIQELIIKQGLKFNSYTEKIEYYAKKGLKNSYTCRVLSEKRKKWVAENKEKLIQLSIKQYKMGADIDSIYTNHKGAFIDTLISKPELTQILTSQIKQEDRRIINTASSIDPPLISNPKIKIESKPSKINHIKTKDLDSSFETEYFKLLENKYNPSQKGPIVNLGIDFGTSYTKVAWYYTQLDNGIITFGTQDNCFKPSVVYINEETNELSFFQKKNFNQIRFFKATMDSEHKENYSTLLSTYKRIKSTKYPSDEIINNIEILCSCFYLANIISFSKNKIESSLRKAIDYLTATMGSPVLSDSDNSNKIYNIALKTGYEIAENFKNPSVLSIDSVYDVYKTVVDNYDDFDFDLRNNDPTYVSIPELFTESIYLLEKKSFDTGNYMIIDIGGGTSDFCFIKKQYSYAVKNKKSNVYTCPYAKVTQLGNEIRLNTKAKDQSVYKSKFESAIEEVAFKTKHRLFEMGNLMKINILTFGGGIIENSQYYESLIKNLADSNRLRGLNIEFELINPFSYQLPDSLKSIKIPQKDKQRLLIALQLANPKTRNLYLSDNPLNYANRDFTPQTLDEFYHQDIRRKNGYEDIN